MAMVDHLVLVRHGQSEGNVASRLSRFGDDTMFTDEFRERPGHEWRLTEEGVEQARMAGAWIATHIQAVYKELSDGFDLYYTSPHVRTRETAAHLAIKGAAWRKEKRVRERDWGWIESMPASEIADKYPDCVSQKVNNPLYWQPPGGESIAQVADTRVRSMNCTLHDQHDNKGRNSAIISTHGEYIWANHLEQERLGHEEWAVAEADAARKIKNCQIVHFTRLDPQTNEQAPRLSWVRSVSPWEAPDDPGKWRFIAQPLLTNEQLLAEVRSVLPMRHIPGAQTT